MTFNDSDDVEIEPKYKIAVLIKINNEHIPIE